MSRYCRTYFKEIPDEQVSEFCSGCKMVCLYNDNESEKFPEE